MSGGERDGAGVLCKFDVGVRVFSGDEIENLLPG
jgi:hypothetical protein